MAEFTAQVVVAGASCFDNVNGFVQLLCTAPVFVTSITLQIITNFQTSTTGSMPGYPPAFATTNTAVLNIPVISGGCVECPNGVTRFPFCYSLPGNLNPSIMLPTLFAALTYHVRALVVTPSRTVDSPYVLLPLLFHKITSLVTKPASFLTNLPSNTSVVLSVARDKFFTGEQIDLTLEIKGDMAIVAMALSFVGTLRTARTTQRVVYNTINLPPVKGARRFLIDIQPVVPPTVSTPHFQFQHEIIIRTQAQGAAPLEAAYPVTVVSSPNPNVRAVYARAHNFPLDRPFFGEHTRPAPAFPPAVVDGRVRGVRENGDPVIVNFAARRLESATTGDALPTKFPLFESAVLPDGWATAFFDNERYFLNVATKTTTWFDPRGPLMPEHVRQKAAAVLNVMVLGAEGLPGVGSKPLEVYMMVFTEATRVFRTPAVKSFDPVYAPQTFVVPLDGTRRTVHVHVCSRGSPDRILGHVAIDLAYLPFPSILEDWFYLFPHPHVERPVSGRVRLRLGYLSRPESLDSDTVTIDHINTALTIPFYPPTPAYRKLVESHERRFKKGFHRMLRLENGHIVLTNDVQAQQPQKPAHTTFFRFGGQQPTDEIPLLENADFYPEEQHARNPDGLFAAVSQPDTLSIPEAGPHAAVAADNAPTPEQPSSSSSLSDDLDQVESVPEEGASVVVDKIAQII